MQSLFNFIVTPKKNRYENEIEVNGKQLIVNTTMDDHRYVSRIGIVESVPKVNPGEIMKGDEVIVHHNVFRRFHDVRGNEKNSSSYFTEDMYFCYHDQIFLYKRDGKWNAPFDFCFVKPIAEKEKRLVTHEKERSNIGIIKYGNSSLNAFKINEGDLIGFTPDSEYEFLVENERMYRMKTKDIAIKYEYEGDEVEYNPSWAGSGR